MKILITGCTGFFGRSLLNYINIMAESNTSISVVGMSRNPELFYSFYPKYKKFDWLKVEEVDLLDRAVLNKLGGDFTHVFHFAVDSTNGPKMKGIERFDQIYYGARNLLDFCLFNNIQNILMTSSGGVYGDAPTELLACHEEILPRLNPFSQNATYSLSKCLVEHLGYIYSRETNLNVKTARCFSFVGEDLPLNAHYAIGNFINDALFNESIVVKGAGNAVRSYMYQADLAEWLFNIMLYGESGCCYNVGSDFPISILDLSYKVKNILSPTKEVKVLNEESFKTNTYFPDITKVKDELGMSLKYDLDNSIICTAEKILNGY